MKVRKIVYLCLAIVAISIAIYSLSKDGALLRVPAEARYEVPARLEIPSLNINTLVEQTGLTPEGAMGVPRVVGNVAWFTPGPRPGEIGSAVIDGHYGALGNGSPSVFDNLSKLKKGDKVYIQDEKGTRISFVVREIRNYDPAADASDIFGSTDGRAHLNLITCDGVWNKASKSYSQRLVVFADKE